MPAELTFAPQSHLNHKDIALTLRDRIRQGDKNVSESFMSPSSEDIKLTLSSGSKDEEKTLYSNGIQGCSTVSILAFHPSTDKMSMVSGHYPNDENDPEVYFDNDPVDENSKINTSEHQQNILVAAPGEKAYDPSNNNQEIVKLFHPKAAQNAVEAAKSLYNIPNAAVHVIPYPMGVTQPHDAFVLQKPANVANAVDFSVLGNVSGRISFNA